MKYVKMVWFFLLCSCPAALQAQTTGYIQRLGVMDGSGNMVYRYYNEQGQRINYQGSASSASVKPMTRSQLERLIHRSREDVQQLTKNINEFNERNAAYKRDLAQYNKNREYYNGVMDELNRWMRDANNELQRAENMNIIGSAGSAAWSNSMARKMNAKRAAQNKRQDILEQYDMSKNLKKSLDAMQKDLNESHALLTKWSQELNQSRQEILKENTTLSEALSKKLYEKGLGDHGSP